MKNEIIIKDNYAEIVLYKKKQEIARTLIDIDKIEVIKNYKWYLDGDGYVYATIKQKM